MNQNETEFYLCAFEDNDGHLYLCPHDIPAIACEEHSKKVLENQRKALQELYTG